MRTNLLGAALLSLALPLVPLAAQDQSHGHGRLGVMLDGSPDTGADTAGARVRSVMPGSPAAAAGLQQGDVISKVNGTAVDGARKLMQLAHGIQPGDTVRVEYRRAGQTKTATLVADRMERRVAMAFRGMPGPGGGHGFGPADGERAPGMMMMFHRHPAGGLRLMEVGKDLGEYFGTSEGFLVLKSPADSASPLKAGDVLLAIDGRKPQSVGHALEILRSYAPGEKAKLEVMRKKQRTNLTWTAPARHGGHDWGESMERSEGPDPADFFEMDLPSFDQVLGLGET
jgi:S1-C subfamily serine protease